MLDPSSLSTPLLGSPSTLYLGEPESAGIPFWVWPVVVGVVLLIPLIVVRRAHRARPASVTATEKLLKLHQVDGKTRRALDRVSSQLELKSSAGLLISATALAEAIGRCDSIKENDKSRLRDLAIRIAKSNAPFQDDD